MKVNNKEFYNKYFYNEPMDINKKALIVYISLVLLMCLFTFINYSFDHINTEMDHGINWFDFFMLFENISYYAIGFFNALYRLIFYGGLGLLGLLFTKKIGFKNILNDEIKQKKSILIILLTGTVIGLYFCGFEALFLNDILSIHRQYVYILNDAFKFPYGIFASFIEGVGCQILNILRLSFFLWLFSKFIKSEKNRVKLFFIIAIFSSLIFTIEHISTAGFIYSSSYKTIFHVPFLEFMVIAALFAPLSFVCILFYKKYGLLSAIIIHVLSNFIWRLLDHFIYMEKRMEWDMMIKEILEK